ncbi:helix-turn-helix domain-containing protein [Pimelobacter simplex]|uniref:Transcriptional regulator, IclR family n=1 Tax=Nocardioides simplex TaxID=2045 RepID=A0A0A1DGI8_NOCSI|nr:IclR family transcriptional regulator [Pimelobacter simplex]AIY15707.1 Transcriptional regulator, IclR family [Pimelobacter simplex]MCG8150508.1 helix-turn-helix domain-containing protein [Pimelobacter simplex]GEB15017.1 IclR family transcriptional regulator [Pimelobacter simplex]SFM87531.1 transcriptional regulator, IclR family [Pimelobacter simplex]
MAQNSFTRGLDVLIAIARNGQVTVAEVADELGLATSTAYRYVRSLRDYGLIEESQGVYVPGWRLMEISGEHLTHTRLAEISGEYLRTLTYQTGETAVLAVRAGSHAICLRQSVSSAPDHYAFRINELLPLYAGAGQRLLLAYAPRPIVEVALANLVAYSSATVRAADLPAVLAQVRRDQFAVSRGEFKEGAIAVAVPVFSNGEVTASLTIAGPSDRCDNPDWVRRATRLLRAAATDMSAALEK